MLKYCNRLFCGENKAFDGMFHGEHGTEAHAHTGEDNVEAEFHRHFGETQARARQLFDAQTFPPTDAGHSKQPLKNKGEHRILLTRPSAISPLRYLSS